MTVELQDYSSLDGEFDKISSIGMFEHVGIANYPRYFQTVHRLLARRLLPASHHRAAGQAQRREFRRSYARKPRSPAISFPGGELDHLGMSVANLERHGFEVHDVEGWREHYARTTRLWCERLLVNQAEAERRSGERTRLWLLYLAGCRSASSAAASASTRRWPRSAARRLRSAADAGRSLSLIDWWREPQPRDCRRHRTGVVANKASPARGTARCACGAGVFVNSP